MGTAAAIGYELRPPNAVQRGMQSVVASRPGAWFFSRTLRHLDDAVARVSRGRTSAAELVGGLPVLDLTTTGRKSGQQRTSHLIAVPCGTDLAVLGTNFGQQGTPAWVLNLEAQPRAVVASHGARCEVVAREATETERAAVMSSSANVYGGYQKYQERITGRRVRIFILEQAPA